MKFPLIIATAALITGVSAFAPPSFAARKTTSLNLFGGQKESGGEGKGPMAGMAQQMEMFKKAQEIASKKKEIDDEVAKLDIKGKSENEKVVASVKIIPGTNPMNPAPDFQVAAIDIDDDFFEESSTEDLGKAVVESIQDGEKNAIASMNEKYLILTEDLQKMMPQQQ